jgi:hypothetical protein
MQLANEYRMILHVPQQPTLREMIQQKHDKIKLCALGCFVGIAVIFVTLMHVLDAFKG